MRSQLPNKSELPLLIVPDYYNYIGVFLTFACNLHCSYCINRFGDLVSGRSILSSSEWMRGLNRIVSRPDLPISLQGGEPTLHPDFYSIVCHIRKNLNIDVLTNLECDLESFMQNITPDRIKRDAPYASIRVSYHPEVMQIEKLAKRVLILQQAGYSIGIWGVEHPAYDMEIRKAHEYCAQLGIDFRTKEFLGEYDGKIFGRYKYQDACNRQARTTVLCRTTELIIGPGGDIYRCHGDLYEGREPIGHIMDPDFTISADFRPCHNYGYCNPCDVKLKTNRFQQQGHTSVEVRFQ